MKASDPSSSPCNGEVELAVTGVHVACLSQACGVHRAEDSEDLGEAAECKVDGPPERVWQSAAYIEYGRVQHT